MTKHNKMWKALRMCSTKASTTSNAETALKFFDTATKKVGGFVGFIVSAGAAYGVYTQTQHHLDWSLKKIVMKEYMPDVVPTEYIDRAQDETLRERLQDYITDQGKFFMLMGESGSGKTTMMQNLLKKEYGEGVIFVKVDSTELLNKNPGEQGGVLKETVLKQFEECENHPRRKHDFLNFIGHANKVRSEAVKKVGWWSFFYQGKEKEKEKDHPLILYITLDSKDDKLPYETMVGIAKSFGVLAAHLSAQDCCRTILEFSKTAISNTIGDLRPNCEHFQVSAMTEDEFPKIGKQVLGVKEDPHNVASEYLEYYHNWLGGHTKALSMSEGKGVKSQIESATNATKEEILRELKKGIAAGYTGYCDILADETEKNVKLLQKIANEGQTGLFGKDTPERNQIKEMKKRNSESTLLRSVGTHCSRIHRYSHALYLHGVKGPDDKDVEQKIAEVKEKFGMNAKSA